MGLSHIVRAHRPEENYVSKRLPYRKKIKSIRILNNILCNLMIVYVLPVFQSFSMYTQRINDSKNL